MSGASDLPQPPAQSPGEKRLLSKIARVGLWLGGAVAVGFCWGIIETAIIRTVFTSGAYFNRDLCYAVNGRVVFYGIAAVVIATLLTFGIKLWGRIRKRPVPLGAAGKRSLIASAGVVAYVNLTLCLLYFWQEVVGWNKSEILKFFLLAVLPLAVVVGAAALLVAWLRRRSGVFRKILSYASYVILIAASAAAAASLGYREYRLLSRPALSAGLPDVVVLTLDAWRADTLGERLTPDIIAYAQRNGVIFTEARAPSSWTLPSFTSSLTGSYNVTDTRALEPTGYKPTAWAEVMRDSGYDTYAVLSNRHLEIVRRLWRGFDHFDYVDFRSPWDKTGFYGTALYFATRGRLMEPEVPGKTTRCLAGRTLDILRRPSRRPKFVWCHILDPHYPYQPLPEVLEAEAPELLDKRRVGIYRKLLSRKNVEIFKGLYDYELKSTDLLVAELIREFAARPNTLVIISSDHGEEFYEHGGTRHGTTLYDEVCRVPLVVALPDEGRDRRPPGESAAPVSLADLAPSVLSYLGLEVPASMDGRPDVLTAGVPDDAPVYATLNQIHTFRASLVQNRKKVILIMKGAELEMEYYDLETDPGELRPLPLDAEGEALKQRLLSWVEQKGVARGLSAETSALFGGREELRALGYM
jgi:arylsulfatase A-like enzyme